MALACVRGHARGVCTAVICAALIVAPHEYYCDAYSLRVALANSEARVGLRLA